MTCKVLTYDNPKTIDQLDSFQEYRDCLHICATKNLRDGVYERYQKLPNEPFITAPVVSSSSLIKILLQQWSKSETKLRQYLALSDIVQNMIDRESPYYQSFRRNQIEVLDTIRLLELAGVQPVDIISQELKLTEKEENFLKLWEKLHNHESIKQLHDLLSYQMKDKVKSSGHDIVSELMKQTYEETDEVFLKINKNVDFDTIILHGFYFMTTEQQRIFLLLKEFGIKIIFLNLYDERYPSTFSFIEKFINERNGWVNKASWGIGKPSIENISIADKFLSDFEGRQIKNDLKVNDIKVTDYPDFYAFLGEFERSDINRTYIAPNAATLNNRLQEYYPELFKGKRRFLAYPIGQFLFHLHQMWNEQRGCLTITEDGLFECFASGWLYDKETLKNARDYTKQLHDAIPFFKGCITIDHWNKRAKKLVEIQKDVLSHFEEEGDNRFNKMMGSPFSRFSHFALSNEEVTQVTRFILSIFQIATDLFGNGKDKISLSEHFSKLRRIVFDSNPHLEKEIQEEERTLVSELKETLQSTPSVEMFLIDDISSAISLYLSGNLPDEHNENEVIKPFIEIDGESFKEKPITHVTGLDENSLPYSEYQLPWPLQNKTFKALADRNVALSFQLLRNDYVKEITRYLMYNLFQFSKDIELSWMVQYEDKDNLDKAIYLSQLGLEPNTKLDLASDNLVDKKIMTKITKDELDAFLAFPVDAIAEFQFCPRRFYYSYITEEYSTFNSDFINEFHFGNLLKSVNGMFGNVSEETVKEEVYKLFPYWTDFKRNLIAEENLKYSNWAQKEFGGYTPYGKDEEFSDLRKLFLFPAIKNQKADNDSKAVAAAIEKLYDNPGSVIPSLREEFEHQLNEHTIQMEATPSENCRFCPHSEFCPDAFHPVDDEERRRTS